MQIWQVAEGSVALGLYFLSISAPEVEFLSKEASYEINNKN